MTRYRAPGWFDPRWRIWSRVQAARPELSPEEVSAWLDTEEGLAWEAHAHQQVAFYLMMLKPDNEKDDGTPWEGVWWCRR